MHGKKLILAVIIDVNSQKIAEESIRKSEEKYRDLLETSSVSILEYNLKDNQISYVNPKLLEILGYAKEELLNEDKISVIIHPNDYEKFFRLTEDKELEFRIFDTYLRNNDEKLSKSD